MEISMKYGKGEVSFSIPEENLLGILESKKVVEEKIEEEIIIDALENPIGGKKLGEIVSIGEKICVVIPDLTRAWQKIDFYLPYVIKELNDAGIKDEDILFISATGAHRKQTKEEHELLIGKDLFNRIKIIDHDAKNQENLVYLGKTTSNTPVFINKQAMECDHIVLTGGIVFHDLAGWSGGRKAILPGIAGYETIMANHALSLNKEIGTGPNPMVRCGVDYGNPLQEDMMEAAAFVNPSFIFNIIMDDKGNISGAVAGDYIKAHEEGKRKVDTTDSVEIKEKADMVIASSGGYPKDINLYQGTKAISNSEKATKDGGTIILLSECIEGMGHSDVEDIIVNYTNNVDREKSVREEFTVAKYIGYAFAETAKRINIILVSEIEASIVEGINVKVVKTIEEALSLVKEIQGNNLKTYIIPEGANVLPRLIK